MKYCFLAMALLLTASVAAQERNEFAIDAQVRSRGEYNNGAIQPREEGDLPALFINERARLGMSFRHDFVELKMSAQHTGVWGQDDIKARNGRVAMNEAWAKVRSRNGLFLQAGRQQLAYDDERMLGLGDWNVAGNSHDAVRAGYEGDGHTAHVFASFNQTAENDPGFYYGGPMPYKTMQGAWYHFQARRTPLGISVLALNVGKEKGEDGNGRTYFMQTFGGHLTYCPGGFDIATSFYYQTGRSVITHYEYNTGAFMASGHLGYTFLPALKLTLGYDYLSGNDGRNTNDHAFNPLFGTHHKFYGAMDYFYASPLSISLNPGLQDAYASCQSQIGKAVNLQLTYHYFMTAEKLSNLDRPIGHEIDLQISVRLAKDATLTAGYSTMLGTETLDVLKGGYHESWQDWAWLTLNVSPRIFSTIW